MNRDEAWKELNDYSILEMYQRDAYRTAQQLGDVTALGIMKIASPDDAYSKELLDAGIQASLRGKTYFSPDIRGEQDRLYLHYRNNTFAIDENRKISLVKHLRYTESSLLHESEFFEITYLFTGACTMQFAIDGALMELAVSANDFVIIPPGLQHAVSIFDDSLLVNILVNRSVFRDAFLSQLPKNNILYKYFSDVLFSEEKASYIHIQKTAARLSEIILEMYINDRTGDNYSFRICDNLLRILLLEILRDQHALMEIPVGSSAADQLAASVLLYMDNNYRAISLADIAKNFHFSKTYLNRVVKERTGVTVQQYIKNMRLNDANRLLATSTIPIGAIAEMVGYNDTSYFIEEYKKAFGKTPKAMRHSIL